MNDEISPLGVQKVTAQQRCTSAFSCISGSDQSVDRSNKWYVLRGVHLSISLYSSRNEQRTVPEMSLPLACGGDSDRLMNDWYASATVHSSSVACWEIVPHLLGLHLGKQTLKYPWCKSRPGRQAASSSRHIPKHGVCLACMIHIRQAEPWACCGYAFLSIIFTLMFGTSSAGSPEDVAPYARTHELNPAMTFVTIGRPTTAMGMSSDRHLVL